MIPIFRELRGIFAVLWNDYRGEFKPKSLLHKNRAPMNKPSGMSWAPGMNIIREPVSSLKCESSILLLLFRLLFIPQLQELLLAWRYSRTYPAKMITDRIHKTSG